MKKNTLALALAAALAMPALPALAQSAGEWTLGVGLANVQPKDGNGKLATLEADIGNNVQPTITFEYFIMDNVGIEVLAATPFEHDVKLEGLGKIGKVQHLPPTVSLQYHFANASDITPFVGVGFNYTVFFKEKTSGALAGNRLQLEDSAGIALHAGLDYKISENGSLRADVRWMDIDSKVKLNGAKIGTAKIDPVVMGVSYVHKF
ncbi:OmpW/AlkL family protein [Frigidibacter mobilis]|uniref:OmpW family outer membrane protein n=1 Tax=Frigidibacter mobilis TaxID=1335048 RepID=A0A159Z5B3_9RHOB|nr:OmpW family outer membrane protein [Frigidibacter mobilis]AMY69578.1 OmpW family outer membrane protein [Frigidibacter mobilis]